MSKWKFTKADELFRGLLKELRTSRDVTQAELASRLAQPQSYVSKYETGDARLDFVETVAVCEGAPCRFHAVRSKLYRDLGRASARKRCLIYETRGDNGLPVRPDNRQEGSRDPSG